MIVNETKPQVATSRRRSCGIGSLYRELRKAPRSWGKYGAELPDRPLRWLLRRLGLAAALFGTLLAGAGTADADLGPARWEKPTVCVEDHVGPNWEAVLPRTAQQYNSHADLQVAYQFQHNGCRGWDQVIEVHWYDGGDDGRPGYTELTWAGDYFVGTQRVYLNSYYGAEFDWGERLHVVNHELGHAVGLAHNDRSDSVMGGPEQEWLSRYDRDELHRRYPW